MQKWALQKSNSQKGFTIVELLIVIVVIAILAAVTIVAYTGIQNRAKQAANLTAIDDWEKGLRLYFVEHGEMPPAVLTDMTAYNGVIQPVVDAIVAGTATSQPVNAELATQGCLPGSYPATDIFRQGECMVQLVTYTFNDPNLPKITSRVSSVVSTNAISTISPEYISTLPNLSMDIQKQSIAITNYPIQMTSSSHQTVAKTGNQTIVTATRGARYSGSSNVNAKFAVISYYAQGDQTCGRGAKTLLSLADIAAQYQQAQEEWNQGGDPSSPITINYSYDGSATWTQCTVTVQ